MYMTLVLLFIVVHVFVPRQETCDDDDDYTTGMSTELPPGVEGCLRPQRPANSFLRVKTLWLDLNYRS